MSEIRDLWTQHCAAPFPLLGDDSDADLVSLDSAASGVISSFLDGASVPDPNSVFVLERCAEELYRKIDDLDLEEREYFRRILKLIVKVHKRLVHP